MPRRKRGSTSRRTRTRSSRSVARTSTPRRPATASNLARRRRATRSAIASMEVPRKATGTRSPGVQALSVRPRLRDRRAKVRPHPKKPTVRRLPELVLSARRLDENAYPPTSTACTRKKAERRRAIIGSGYGGVNGFTNYRSRRKCR